VNSINWARIMAQIVYYFTAAAALGSPSRTMSFTVPTGNFGDIFAGYAARAMGLPVSKLVIATNVNDILARTLASGRYEIRGVAETMSPSMDIQVSSNFERLLFEVSGRSSERVVDLMESLSSQRAFALSRDELSAIRARFDAHTTDEAATLATIARVRQHTGLTVDPHTAVGIAAAGRTAREAGVPMITLSTAHPAKFPAAVAKAIGAEPAVPPAIERQRGLPERVTVLPNDVARIAAFVADRARAGGKRS
jgi:threonine synthase